MKLTVDAGLSQEDANAAAAACLASVVTQHCSAESVTIISRKTVAGRRHRLMWVT